MFRSRARGSSTRASAVPQTCTQPRPCYCMARKPAGASSWPLATPRHASTSASATAYWSRSPSSALRTAEAGLRRPQAPRHRASHCRPHGARLLLLVAAAC